MNNPLDREALIDRHLHGQATPEDEAMLFQLSVDDPDVAGELYERALLEQDLYDMFQAATEAPAKRLVFQHTQWRRFVAPLAAAAAALLMCVFGLNMYLAKQAVLGRVVAVTGQTQKINGPSSVLLKVGDLLQPGDTVKVGAESYIKYAYADGSMVRLEKDAQCELIADKIWQTKGIKLDAGTLMAQVAKQSYGRPMLLTTPHAKVRVVGTEFVLSVESKDTGLSVVNGKVAMTGVSGGKAVGKAVTVATGQFAAVEKGKAPAVWTRFKNGTHVELAGPVERTLHFVPRLLKDGVHFRLRPGTNVESRVTATLDQISGGEGIGTHFKVTGVTSNEGSLVWIDVRTIEKAEANKAQR